MSDTQIDLDKITTLTTTIAKEEQEQDHPILLTSETKNYSNKNKMNGEITQLQIEADSLLAQKKLSLATEKYSKYCESIAQHTGADSILTADALFQYGNCLLELARTESCVLGEEAPLRGVNAVDSSTNDDDDENDVQDNPFVAEEKKESIEAENSSMKVVPEASSNEIAQEQQDAEDDEDYEDEEEVSPEEEPSNMQLAWEALDAARIIYSIHKNKDKWIDTLLSLSDISLESGQWDMAIQDMLDALSLNHMKNSDRKLAELYYKLSLAYEYQGSLDQAKDAAKNCIKTLDNKLKELSVVGTEDAATEKKEIEAFFPELIDRMNDIEELLAATSHVQEVKEALKKQEAVEPKDISNLVKRKKVVADEESSKKVKIMEENDKQQVYQKDEQEYDTSPPSSVENQSELKTEETSN